MTSDVVVSVCMITYNHERYIETAIESVLAQETSFRVELVIGEDCSADSTRQIVESYARRFPDRIRVLLPARNLGMMPNLIATLRECGGRFVALLEGDDYWIDTRKLAKQVRHLEGAPECSLSFHNAYVQRADGIRSVFHREIDRSEFGGEDLWDRWLIPTASAVFRNPRLGETPAFMEKATHGDLSLFLLVAEAGSLGYIDEIMSIYRLHEGGITTSFTGISFNRLEIDFLWALDAHFQGKYRSQVRRRVSGLDRSTALHMAAEGRRSEALRHLWKSWTNHLPMDRRALRENAQAGVGIIAPGAYRWLRRRVGRLGSPRGELWFVDR